VSTALSIEFWYTLLAIISKFMSGHSKWHTIKHKKGALDAQRGKIFSKHSKLIEIAARGGGDPDMNPSLRLAIDNAKADNTPNANIEKAIRKGTGADKDASLLVEVAYEGYGPGGVAFCVQTITDNKNRSVSNIRTIFAKHGGNLGSAGCVSYLFSRKGIIVVNLEGKNVEDVELQVIDAGADDIKISDGMMDVFTEPNQLGTVANKLKNLGLKVESQELTLVPKNTMKIEDQSVGDKIVALMEALDDDDDVTNVSTNAEL